MAYNSDYDFIYHQEKAEEHRKEQSSKNRTRFRTVGLIACIAGIASIYEGHFFEGILFQSIPIISFYITKDM